MFDSLSKKIGGALDGIKNRGVITEKEFDDFVRKLRLTFLEADVSLPVTKQFIANVRESVIGKSRVKGISTPAVIGSVVKEELVKILGGESQKFEFPKFGKQILMFVGLQGVGKTTTAAKLALLIRKKFKKNILLSSVDIYRPAARKQLEILAKQIDVDTVPIVEGEDVDAIVKKTLDLFNNSHEGYDVLMVDTAGRSQIDSVLMEELKVIKNRLQPSEIFQVLDAMMGQDSLNVARTFHSEIGTTGVIVSRLDSDARVGSVLSVRQSVGLPIRFCGAGERVNDLEEFHPERMAGRIMGAGDIASLVEYASSEVGEERIGSIRKRIEAGKFDYDDLVLQLKSIDKLGGIAKLLRFIPGINKVPTEHLVDDTTLKKNLAMIGSMTKRERACLDSINQSRKSRIASGAGVKIYEVNKLIKNFEKARLLALKIGKVGATNEKSIHDLNELLRK
ncbi:signal recognition particle protein [Neorickettsia sennetsu]|uniref:signal-recognition-particle GTPase n=1 Tax=Ehrlichia sennetsu (strain ATCC VR-367 / Miyayama) TaxID=222891 RepID=Q2GDM3_EHRS3|nr:signal recognition particle receptor subunit alpha [Neorickettsia sennetsu]ABD45743.1 signal recognition particle protein [Neorickettsia sennetsu str. Miyayama]